MSFGWESFVLTDKDAKRRYMLAQLYSALQGHIGVDMAAYVVAQMAGEKYAGDEIDIGLDHQSCINIPLRADAWGRRNQLNYAFWSELYDFVMRDDVVIVGGNDNEPESKPVVEGREFIIPMLTDAPNGILARHDALGFWSLYDPSSGSKMWFSMGGDRQFTYTSVPELVDIKITDYCKYGCPFCYQDSSDKGKPASFKDIETIARELAHIGTYEVAIGGGEPTTHPDFISILKEFRHNGITPNVTTNNPKVLDNAEVVSLVGRIALSVSGYTRGAACSLASREDKLAFQVVDQTVDDYAVGGIIAVANALHIPITFLGLKTSGRGAKYRPLKYDVGLAPYMASVRRLSVDTVFAKQYASEIAGLKVSPKLFATEDGMDSMYIDAVAMTARKNSYEPGTEYKLQGTIDIKAVFAQIHNEMGLTYADGTD